MLSRLVGWPAYPRTLKYAPEVTIDGHGWTTEEFIKWEKYRLETMFKPIQMMAPEGVEDEKGPVLPSGFILYELKDQKPTPPDEPKKEDK